MLFPEAVVQGHLKGYSVEEKELIEDDLQNIEGLSFRGKKAEAPPHYLATAGGPGSMKSTILETFLKESGERNFVYTDPDMRGLKLMINTYILDMAPLCH